MKNRILLFTAVALCATCASAKQFNIGVEAGYDFAHYRDMKGFVTETTADSKVTKTTAVTSQHSQQIDTYTEVRENGKVTTSDWSTTQTGRLPQMHGFHVGPTFDWRFAERHGLGLRFALQYQFLTTDGMVFDLKDQRDARKQLDITCNTYSHALDIPVRLSYTWTIKNDWNIWIMTGPKFNIGLSYTANMKSSQSEEATYNYYTGEITTTVSGQKTTKKMDDDAEKYIPFDASWGIGFGFGYKNFNFSVCYDLGFTDMHGYQEYDVAVLGSTKMYEVHTTYNNQLQVTLSYTWPVLKSQKAAAQ